MNSFLMEIKPFGETHAIGAVSKTRQIREAIANFLDENPQEWEQIAKHLRPQGISGSAQFDHAVASMRIMIHIPSLRELFELNEREVWYHLDAVLRARGYKMARGYVVGHVDDDNGAAVVAPEAPVDETGTDDVTEPVGEVA